jgi:hypothetical protein
MAQIQNPFEHHLFRISSISFIVGAVLMIVSTMLHPSKEEPFNRSLVLTECSNIDS